ncbi:MAG: SUMF1/EgtB/PvdO family nonheme iron enzyme [Polyangiaceae bacterium]|nr:SUMF1/EgtB/PvdO family nonheme iron enzyme [Polyangiaceae bacterium]
MTTRPAPDDPLGLAGTTLAGKYTIERCVGEGGFAVVYRAQHDIWKKPVAIKLFSGLASSPVDQRDALLQAFVNEGALLTELSSETAAIVQARDVGTHTTADGAWLPYMVLEWLDGRPLDDVLEAERAAGRGRFTLGETMALLGPVARALDVAHRRGVAHRDVKPANIFVLGANPRSGSATVKVLDFGVAKMVSDSSHLQAALAKTGASITSFTPQYGAPEQFSRTYGATGPWTDVYAVALCVVELLAGRPALEGTDVVQLAFSSSSSERRPVPSAFGVPVPPEVEAVLRKALSTDPRQRPARCGELWDELEAAAGLRSRGETVVAPVSAGPAPASAPRDPVVSASVAATVLGDGPPVGATGGSASFTPVIPPAASRSRLGLVLGGAGVVTAIAAAAHFAPRRSPEPPVAATATPTASAAPAASAAAATPTTCPEDMALIPAGQFFMGSDADDAPKNQRPSHNVKLPAFCLDLNEVTASRYKACSDAGQCRRAPTSVDFPGLAPKDRPKFDALCTGQAPERSDHPVNCVDWDSAQTYCAAQDRRLPTEAEWEYAARGPDGRVYPWGDEKPTARHLNACGPECVRWGRENGVTLQPLYEDDDGFPATAPVGRFPLGSSRFGPRDMVGNVFEWVADWEAEYTSEPRVDPRGPETGARRVIRGGAFNGWFEAWLHPSFRYAQVPTARSHGIGFRCAKPLGG